MNTILNADTVRDVLSQLPDPAGGGDVVSTGRLSAIVVRGDTVGFALAGRPDDPVTARVQAQAEALVKTLAGVAAVRVALTAHRAAPKLASKAARHTPLTMPNIKRFIAVGSGKGGVGKSTVAVNLALALQAQGWRVGMLDADIYGPSQPMLLGLTQAPKPSANAERQLTPLYAYGMPVMSMGLLVDAESPIIWRGPMVMGAVEQFLRDVQWGDLDALIIDLPPGTGDVQLTLGQRLRLTGAVVVSTPQDLALLDARKAVAMFQRLNVPILGMIENMAVYICENCGHAAHIFSHGGVGAAAEKLGIPYLGAIPLDARLREVSDAGTPLVVAQPNHPVAQSFLTIAAQLVANAVTAAA